MHQHSRTSLEPSTGGGLTPSQLMMRQDYKSAVVPLPPFE